MGDGMRDNTNVQTHRALLRSLLWTAQIGGSLLVSVFVIANVMHGSSPMWLGVAVIATAYVAWKQHCWSRRYAALQKDSSLSAAPEQEYETQEAPLELMERTR